MSDLPEVINHQLEQLLDDTSMLAIKMPMKLQKEGYTNVGEHGGEYALPVHSA